MLLGFGVHRARAHVKLERHLCRENKSTAEHNYSYIYDFGPRQCLAMPASSDKSADALA